MIKKLVSLLCLLSITVTLIPNTYVFADNTNNDNNQEIVLQALGLDDATALGMATNDYFISALSGFLYEKDGKPTAEDFAKSIGLIKSGEVYDGSKTITKEDALRYAVATLGYIGYAESLGEDGVRTVASNLGLTKGLGIIDSNLITVNECRVLLHNMLEVEPMSAVVSEGQVKHIIESDQTLLSKYRDVHKVRGILTSDEITSLDKEAGCREGYITIDNTLYATESNVLEEKLLGKDIEAYVTRDKDDELTVLCIYEKSGRNSEIIIEAKDICAVTDDYSILEYYENNNLKKAKIADVPMVICNGVFYGGYTVDDFKPDSGNVRLLDNNNDNKYDVIFINSYETVVVEAVDTNRKIIYNKFKTEGNIPSIDLDANALDFRYTISNEFGRIDLADIKNGDILAVAKSKSVDNVVIEILVSSDTFAGKLQRINEGYMEILIDDESYPITQSFLRFRNEEQNIVLGNTYTFFMDALGNVAYWGKITEDGYAIVERVYVDEENEKLYASYMNLNSVWIDAPIAEKIKVNETLYKDWDVAYDAVLEDIKGEVVKLTFNDNEEIKRIETATETSSSNEDKFTKTSYESLVYRSGVRVFSDQATGKCKYYLEDNAKLIVIPEDYRNKYGYEVRDPGGFFSGDTSYTLAFYDIDKFGFSEIAVVRYTPQVKNKLFIVLDTYSVVDDDEARSQVMGYAGDFENLTLTGVSETTFNGVEKGDIIKVSVNPEGYVDYISPVFKLSRLAENDGDQYMSDQQFGSVSNMAGEVVDIKSDKNRILVNINGTQYSYRISDSTTVQRYDSMEGIEKASIHDIMCGDKIFINLSWGSVQQIIIHE